MPEEKLRTGDSSLTGATRQEVLPQPTPQAAILEKKSKWGHNPESWMVWLTCALMVIGIVTGAIFYCQFREMSRQTEILSDQGKQASADSIAAGRRVDRQLELLRQQAGSAHASVEAMQQQMRQDQRAWISLSMREEMQYTAGQSVTTNVQLLNTGKTPARHIRIETGLQKLATQDAPDLTFGSKTAQAYGTVGAVFPNQPPIPIPAQWMLPTKDHKEPLVGIISNQDIQDLRAGKIYFVVYARVKYTDIFGIERTTRFCQFETTPLKSISVNARTCTDFNGVDDK
jgi:hypothetical protein